MAGEFAGARDAFFSGGARDGTAAAVEVTLKEVHAAFVAFFQADGAGEEAFAVATDVARWAGVAASTAGVWVAHQVHAHAVAGSESVLAFEGADPVGAFKAFWASQAAGAAVVGVCAEVHAHPCTLGHPLRARELTASRDAKRSARAGCSAGAAVQRIRGEVAADAAALGQPVLTFELADPPRAHLAGGTRKITRTAMQDVRPLIHAVAAAIGQRQRTRKGTLPPAANGPGRATQPARTAMMKVTLEVVTGHSADVQAVGTPQRALALLTSVAIVAAIVAPSAITAVARDDHALMVAERLARRTPHRHKDVIQDIGNVRALNRPLAATTKRNQENRDPAAHPA